MLSHLTSMEIETSSVVFLGNWFISLEHISCTLSVRQHCFILILWVLFFFLWFLRVNDLFLLKHWFGHFEKIEVYFCIFRRVFRSSWTNSFNERQLSWVLVHSFFFFFEELNCFEQLVLVLINIEQVFQELNIVSFFIPRALYFLILEPRIGRFCLLSQTAHHGINRVIFIQKWIHDPLSQSEALQTIQHIASELLQVSEINKSYCKMSS